MLVEEQGKSRLREQLVGFIRKEAAVRRGIDGGINPVFAVNSDVYKIIEPELNTLSTEGIEVTLTKHVDQGIVMAIPASYVKQFEEMWRKLDEHGE